MGTKGLRGTRLGMGASLPPEFPRLVAVRLELPGREVALAGATEEGAAGGVGGGGGSCTVGVVGNSANGSARLLCTCRTRWLGSVELIKSGGRMPLGAAFCGLTVGLGKEELVACCPDDAVTDGDGDAPATGTAEGETVGLAVVVVSPPHPPTIKARMALTAPNEMWHETWRETWRIPLLPN